MNKTESIRAMIQLLDNDQLHTIKNDHTDCAYCGQPAFCIGPDESDFINATTATCSECCEHHYNEQEYCCFAIKELKPIIVSMYGEK